MATRLRITDIVGVHGTEYTIEIDDTEFSGTATEGDCAVPGFELSWDTPSREANMGGVMGSSATVLLLVQGTAEQDLVDDMVNAIEGRFTVRILRKQVAEAQKLLWVGYVITDASEGSDEALPYVHKIACVDGLAALKKKKYANGVAVQPQRTILGHVLEILSYITTTQLYYTATADYIGTTVKWRSTLHGTPAANFCPSAHTRVAGEVFATKDDRTGQYTFMDCLAVLEAICEVFRARIYYSDGLWRFEQLNARESGSWPIRVFDRGANYKSGGVFGNTQFTINANENGTKVTGIKYTWFPPLREVTATYKHRTFVNWLAGQAWRWGSNSLGGEYDVFGFNDISLDGAYGIISGTISYKVTGGSSTTPFRLVFTMSVKSDTTTLKRGSSVVPNTNIVQLDAPEWLGTTNLVDISTGFIFQGAQEGEVHFAIQTPVFPSGTKTIKIDFTSGGGSKLDVNGNTVFATTDNWDTKNLMLQVVNSSSTVNFYDEKKYKATGNAANSETAELQPLFGHAIEPWTPTKVQVRNGPSGTWTDSEIDWQHQGATAVFALEELTVRELLTAHVAPRMRLRGTVMGRYLDAHASMYIDATNEFWIFLGGTYNPYDHLLTGEWYLQGYDSNIIEPGNPGGGVVVTEEDNGAQVPEIQALPPSGQTVAGSAVGQPLNADSNIALAALATNYANTAIAAGAVTSIPLRFPAKANSYLPGDDIMLLNPQTGKITTLAVTTANAEGATSIAVSGTLDAGYPGGSFVIYSALNKFTQQGSAQAVELPPIGAALQYLRVNAGATAIEWATLTLPSGTVTSVALSLPSALFSVSGSPVTASGTLAAALVAQAANIIFAGPASGGAAAPTFRALVAADIPAHSAALITSGTLPVARGGTGLGALGAALQYLRVNSGATALEWATLTLPSGTVTSVALSLPSALFSVSGSPVTASGTLAAALVAQAANIIFAGPASGGAAAPTFRALVAADIPPHSAALITSGTLPVARGGTGLAALGSAFQYMRVNSGATALEWANFPNFIIASGTPAAGQMTYFTSATDVAGASGTTWDNTNGRLGLGGTPLVRLHLFGTDGMVVPSGTVAQRPSAAGLSYIVRGNTAFQGLEVRSPQGSWHRLTNGISLPGFTVGGGAGTAPTINIVGSDMGGSVTIQAGTAPGAAGTDIVTVNFANTFSTTPWVVICGGSANFWTAQFFIFSAGNGGFTIRAATALTAGATYVVRYITTN